MFGRNFFYILVGMGIAIPLTSITHALTTSERNEIVTMQQYADQFTGSFKPVNDGLIQVFTYETICKGFYTIEDNGFEARYTGFGDLADLYTFTLPSRKPIIDSVASTTDEKIIDIIIDTIP